VWVEGTDVGTANLSLILYSNSSDKFFEDTVKFTIVNVDLDIDSNNDGTISPHNGSDTEDSIEDDANHLGKRIFVNNDDDNVNGVADAVDGHSAYDDVDDNDFAEIKLSYHGFTPANMSGYKLQLDWTNGLNLYAGKDKEALTQTEWTLGSAITLPSSIYAEGITTGRQTVSWRLVKTSTSEIVASDTVAINVEKIVWPFATQTYQQNWNERPTSDWVGLDVAEAWYMDKTLVDYVMTPGTKGHLETIHPNLDNPNAPGTQVTWASKEGGLSPTTDTYTNGFTMEFDYSFETSRFSPTGYIQASGKPAKLSFVGNSGVKFGTMTSGKLCEVNILDVKSMVAEGGGLNEFDPSQNGYVRSNGDVDTNDQYQTEALKTLVTGVIYNGDYDNMKDYQDVDPDDPPTAQDFYDTLVNNYNRTNGHIKIDVTLVSGSTYTVNVYLDNEQQTCYSDAITLTSLATLNLQSHWGSGVIFSNMDVTAKA